MYSGPLIVALLVLGGRLAYGFLWMHHCLNILPIAKLAAPRK
jgi:hypothetical protein